MIDVELSELTQHLVVVLHELVRGLEAKQLSPQDPVAAAPHPLCDIAHPDPLQIPEREICYRVRRQLFQSGGRAQTPLIDCHTPSCSNRLMIDIRDEGPADRRAVYQVVSSAFGQSAEADLVAALQQAGDSIISLVAEEEGRIVGHVVLSRMEAPFPALALAPVSVVPTRQRSGIGSALIQRQ